MPPNPSPRTNVRSGRAFANHAVRGSAPVPLLHRHPANEGARENRGTAAVKLPPGVTKIGDALVGIAGNGN